MSEFKKQPVKIQAIRYDGKWKTVEEIIKKFGMNRPLSWHPDGEPFLMISTLEGEMKANIGDWIIQGVHGEIYPCKDDIFKQTYTPSGALREFIKILMENHDPSECCGNCQSLLKIHNWRTNSYDRGYCKNQDSKYNGCGFMNLCDWCLQFNRGIPLEFPEVDGLDLNQFIIDHHNYFNSKEPERADELNGNDNIRR